MLYKSVREFRPTIIHVFAMCVLYDINFVCELSVNFFSSTLLLLGKIAANFQDIYWMFRNAPSHRDY